MFGSKKGSSSSSSSKLVLFSQGRKGPSPKQSSEHSSEQDVEASRAQQVLVSAYVTPTADHIRFYINVGQRPSTLLEGQGDHVTSYTLIVQTLLSCANTNLKEALALMKTFAEKVLEEKHFDLFKKIQAPATHEHGQRPALMGFLKDSTTLLPPAIDEKALNVFNKELKFAKVGLLCNYLAELATCLLEGLQEHKLTTVFSRGRENKVVSEGQKAKEAIRALATINQICQFSDVSDASAELTSQVINQIIYSLRSCQTNEPQEDHILRYGIFALIQTGVLSVEEGQKKESYVDELIQWLENNKDNSNAIKGKFIELRDDMMSTDVPEAVTLWLNTVTVFVGNLFDYNRMLDFDLNSAFPLKDRSAKQKKDYANPNAYWKACLKDFFPEAVISVSSTKGTVTREKINQLVEVIDRHFVAIEAAFPYVFKFFDVKLIEQKFLEDVVLKQQGWSKHKVSKKDFLTIIELQTQLNEARDDLISGRKMQPSSSS